MLERYVTSIIGFLLVFVKRRAVLVTNRPYLGFKLGTVTFDTSAWIGGLAILSMLIGG